MRRFRSLGAALLSVACALSLGASRVGAQEVTSDETPSHLAPTPSFAGYTLRPLEPATRLEIGAGRNLTLADVLRSVDTHHPPLEAAEERVRALEGSRLAAEGGFDLTLNGNAFTSLVGYYQYGRADLYLNQPTPLWGTTVFAGWRIGRPFRTSIPDYYGGVETFDVGEVRAGVTVPILRDGPIDSRRATLARAERAVEAGRFDVEARRLRVRFAATDLYYRWVAAGLRYRTAANLAAIAEERDAQIEARARNGAIPAIEHLENRRAILERRQALVAAERAVERASIALSLYLRDADGNPRRAEPAEVPLVFVAARAVTVRDADTLFARAREDRPELRRYDAQRRALEVAREHAENQMLPRLDATLSANMDLGAASLPDPDENRSLQNAQGTPYVEGVLLLQVPFQMRDGRGRAEAASAELRVLDAERTFAEDTIRNEVDDALSALQAAERTLALATESAEVAEAVAAAERARFGHGLSTLLIVNLRESTAAQAEQGRIDATAELRVATALLDTVLGAGVH